MIAQTIQLALAPVFVLVAVGNILNLLSTRLGRIVDRSRTLQEKHRETSGHEHDMVVREIRLIDRRIDLVGRAILMLVLSGIAIGLTVAVLFLEELLGANLQGIASVTFIIAVGMLMYGLVLFLRETRDASRALRIPEELLEKDREL
jgi:ABC-type nickel/cobalt efflux system permease component RcnA